MSLFDKCRAFRAYAETVRQAVDDPFYPPVQRYTAEGAVMGNEPRAMFGGNNYLGLARDARVVAAGVQALERYGTSSTGSRALNGNLALHETLEAELADFFGKPAALVFATGYQTNLGVLSSLCRSQDIVVVDEYAHASLLDGARLSGARVRSFLHSDPHDLARVLEAHSDTAGNLLVVVDGVYSMEGDIAPLPELVAVAHRQGATVLVDDAHGAGVLGREGRGTCSLHGVATDVDLITVTFSKAFASVGGAVLGDAEAVDYMRYTARSQLYSAASTPADTAAALAALRIARAEPWRGEHAVAHARRLASGLAGMGYRVVGGATPIRCVRFRDDLQVFKAWRAVMDAGVYTNPVVPPVASPRLRLSCTAAHTEQDLTRGLDAFERVAAAFVDPRADEQ
ncbi:aminotransferase class I/II-fold pyridoxal phosphate-dependent enzyme [Streptomyces syringium]|uniref:aminotransferase class I/II-fold pyridoxal phosphate-dependent enzyme n=1 Tax=Streptomyces syringium TaxID=76729 RepID=UPI0033DD6A2D